MIAATLFTLSFVLFLLFEFQEVKKQYFKDEFSEVRNFNKAIGAYQKIHGKPFRSSDKMGEK